MNRAWHQQQANNARRAATRHHNLNPSNPSSGYWFWRGKYEAHCEAMTAIDRSKRVIKRQKKAA